MNANEDSNKKKEIKAKISMEVTEKDEPGIGEHICRFIYAVCQLSLAVFVISTGLVAFSADPEHSGTIGTVQVASILVCVTSFWIVVAYKALRDEGCDIGGSDQYL